MGSLGDGALMTENSLAQIRVVATYPKLAFVYGAAGGCTIEIDGDRQRHAWGTSEFAVSPGQHRVAVGYPWAMMAMCGRNEIVVDLAPGQTVSVHYKARYLRFFRGRIHEQLEQTSNLPAT